jgi:hypothetical protein
MGVKTPSRGRCRVIHRAPRVDEHDWVSVPRHVAYDVAKVGRQKLTPGRIPEAAWVRRCRSCDVFSVRLRSFGEESFGVFTLPDLAKRCHRLF